MVVRIMENFLFRMFRTRENVRIKKDVRIMGSRIKESLLYLEKVFHSVHNLIALYFCDISAFSFSSITTFYLNLKLSVFLLFMQCENIF